MVASTMTNASGVFNIFLNLLQFPLQSVLSSCQVVVATPLASCNASLPVVGFLNAPLQLVGTIVRGVTRVVILAPIVFQLL